MYIRVLMLDEDGPLIKLTTEIAMNDEGQVVVLDIDDKDYLTSRNTILASNFENYLHRALINGYVDITDLGIFDYPDDDDDEDDDE